MADAAAHRSADGAWAWHDGPFAAIRQRTICTPEDAFEGGPVVSAETGAALVFDGRLDNRDDLASRLAISPSDLRTLPDASIALRAWLRWREDVPVHLLGDFALVAWDRAAREVFCATDAFGVRPLHYYLSDQIFVFATELTQLFVHPLVPRRPDERAIGEFLRGEPRGDGRTLYEGIRRLPHARSLTISPGHERLTRYWEPSQRVIVRRDDAEYADGFREQFDRAVAVRLRSAGPIGAHLSGGLDSSSVLVTAARMADPKKLTAFSLAFDGPPEADERHYINAVLRHVGISGVGMPPPAFDPEAARAQVARRQYLPDFPTNLVAASLRRAMAARNIRVSLSGAGGDLGLSGSCFYYSDLLKQGRLAAFTRRYRDVARSPDHGWCSAELVRCAVWPLLPARARRLLRPLARRATGLTIPTWIGAAFARRTGIDEPPDAAPRPHESSLANAIIGRGYDDGLTHVVHDLYELASSDETIYDRHPFLDRQLIDFILTLPDDQRWKNGQMKFVLRRAIGPRLPPLVRDRSDRSKADFSSLTLLALDGLGGRRFFERLSIESEGWVAPGMLPILHDRMRRLHAAHDLKYGDLGWQLWSAAAVELWYSAIFGTTHTERTTWSKATTTSPIVQSGGPAARIASPTIGRS